jgi:hypothetical protein
MIKIFIAIIGLTLMVAQITLKNPCLAQQQSITGAIYDSVPKCYDFVGVEKGTVGEYELGKAFIAGKDDPDPPPPPPPPRPR